jgi:endonuclease-3
MQPEPLFPVPPDPRILEVDARLLEHYKAPPPRDLWDPLTQFIYSLLSSRTKTTESHQVMHNLRDRYGVWENLRDAPVEEIEVAIQGITFPEVKAPRLKLALMQITARYGSLTLDFLAKYRTEKIREWLEQFEGVGPKTSAAIVNFSTLRRRALCVDSNHLRVVQRLALTPRADAGLTEERLMRRIPADWDAVKLDEHHSLVKLHAQTLCVFSDPLCARCPLLSMCPSGKKKMPAQYTQARP